VPTRVGPQDDTLFGGRGGEHESSFRESFSSVRRRRRHRIVYFEEFGDIRDAIAREKQIKGWLRAKKVALIESMNPEWKELAPEWMKKPRPAARCHPEANR